MVGKLNIYFVSVYTEEDAENLLAIVEVYRSKLKVGVIKKIF